MRNDHPIILYLWRKTIDNNSLLHVAVAAFAVNLFGFEGTVARVCSDVGNLLKLFQSTYIATKIDFFTLLSEIVLLFTLHRKRSYFSTH